MTIQEAAEKIVEYVDDNIDGLGSNQADKLREWLKDILIEVVQHYI